MTHYSIMKQPTGLCIMGLKTYMIWQNELRKIGTDYFLNAEA